MAKMSENSIKVLNYLKAAGVGVPFTYKQVAEDLNFEHQTVVTGAIGSTRSGMVKRGLVEKFVEAVEDENGKITNVKKFALTQAGMDFDPEAVED